MKAFVTVGSTEFFELSRATLDLDFCESVAMRGYTELVVQVGSADVTSLVELLHYTATHRDEAVSNGNSPVPKVSDNGNNFSEITFHSEVLNATLSIKIFRYKRSLRQDMEDADIIISHAGSGSIIEALELNKPLIVVANANLMDNHQCELAEELQAQGYLAYTTPEKLLDTVRLSHTALSAIEPLKYPRKAWQRAPVSKLAELLLDTMGHS